MNQVKPTINLSPDWEETGPERCPHARLTSKMQINICGVGMHIEAYALNQAGGALDEDFVLEVECAYPLNGDQALELMRRNGHVYVVVAFPHAL